MAAVGADAQARSTRSAEGLTTAQAGSDVFVVLTLASLPVFADQKTSAKEFSMKRIVDATKRRRRRFVLCVPFVLIVAAAFLISGSAVATTTGCTNTATLAGSAFEIDTNANLVVNTTGCIDWLEAVRSAPVYWKTTTPPPVPATSRSDKGPRRTTRIRRS